MVNTVETETMNRIASIFYGTMVEERIVRIEMCMKALVECH